MAGFRFKLLASGSSGNATLIEAGGTRLLIDAGIAPRTLAGRLRALDVDPSSLAAVLLSHEHADHILGALSFSKRFGVPLCGSYGTLVAVGAPSDCRPLAAGETRPFGELTVTTVTVPHDAAEPFGFILRFAGLTLGHVTDFGRFEPQIVQALGDCHALVLESNYDPDLLRTGPYPWPLKERILGSAGHAANPDVGAYLSRELAPSCRTVVLAHLSETNNHPSLVERTAASALDRARRSDVRLAISDRHGTDWLPVEQTGPTVATPQLRLF